MLLLASYRSHFDNVPVALSHRQVGTGKKKSPPVRAGLSHREARALRGLRSAHHKQVAENRKRHAVGDAGGGIGDFQRLS